MNLNLTAIAFRIINFALFVYLAWYVFKKYARQSIEDEITQQEAVRERLIAQHGELEETTENLKEEHHSLKTTIKELSDKARTWQTHTDEQAQENRAEVQRNFESLIKTLKIQESVHREHLLRTAALEGAIELAEKQMRQSVENPKIALQMQDIIEKITK